MPVALPADRLATLIEGLCRAVAAHGVRGLLTAPLLLLLWARLRRMAGRARNLARRLEAGAPLSRPRPKAPPRTPSPYIRLPRGLAWLVRAVPATAAGASQLQFLLADPQMAELAQSPPMRRLLRPLCRLLGVAPPAADPPPPEASPPASSPCAPPEPRAAAPPPQPAPQVCLTSTAPPLSA
jgi:hypothetical protein